jgi:hypothetical protein
MAANKLGVLALTLVAHIYASGAPGLLTLCVHNDGVVQYEPTLELCCQLNEQGQGECCSFEDAHPGESDGFTPEDGCQDYCVILSQVPVSPSSVERLLLGSPELREVLSTWVVPPANPILEWPVSSGFCGPPPDHVLKDLATVVLRI